MELDRLKKKVLVAWISYVLLSMTANARATALHAIDEPLLASSSTLADLSLDVLSRGASLSFLATGASMHPFIRDGDLITLGPLLDHRPGIGDIVAFMDPRTERLTVHRVVGRKNGLLVTKGDAVSRPDGLVPEAEILGRVTRIERNNRSVLLRLGPGRVAIALLSRCTFGLAACKPLWRFVRLLLRLRGVTNKRS
jgi:signal peptidase I